jgi:ubiquinone/menaquinone biosynthesis C-methylase UbiE
LRSHRRIAQRIPGGLLPLASRILPGHAIPGCHVLDAGCGRTAEVGVRLADAGMRVVGIDLVDEGAPPIPFAKSNLEELPIRNSSVDLVVSRSVMEHIVTPEKVWREAYRVLKPGGWFVFLTPNAWDYVSVIARLIPNRYHPRIVHFCEGRDLEDVFPTVYRCNTPAQIRKYARAAGFETPSVRYLTQYPAALWFHPVAFTIGTGYERLTRLRALRFLQPWILGSARRP